MMNLSAVGKSTLDVEVIHISAHEIWLLTDNQELFINANYQITSKA